MSSVGRRPLIALLVTGVLVAAVAGGCGSRRADSELIAAAATRPGAATQSGPSGTPTTSPTSGSDGVAAGGSDVGGVTAGGGATTVAGAEAPSAASAGHASSPGATGPLQPIKIGNIGVYSGIPGASTRNGLAAVKAWEQWTNAHGGVAGHQVRVLVADDGGDPAQSRAARKRLVEEEHVVAFVGDHDFLTVASAAAYHAQTRVPVVGGTGTQVYYDSPFFFPQNTFAPADTLAAIADLAPDLTKLASIVCVEDRATCGDAGTAWAAAAGGFGQQLVYQAQVSVAQPDFTGECISARNAGAQVVLLALDASATQRLALSCARQGYRPRFAGLQVTQSLAGVGDLDGLIFASPSFPWTSKSSASRQAFATAMATYAPGADLDPAATTAWTAGVLFTRAVELAGPKGVITNEDVLRGLWSIHDETLGGLIAPLTFTKGQTAKKKLCYFTMVTSGGAWTTPKGDAITCR